MSTELHPDKAFATYVTKVYDGPIPLHQYRECERAFVAGIHALLCHMVHLQDPEVADKELERLFAWTIDYGRRVGGRGHN